MKKSQECAIEPTRSSDSKSKVRRNLKFSSQKLVTVDTDSNFSLQYDELLDSITEFCEEIQVKGYANVKSTCEVLKRYDILKQFKACIDQYWIEIEKSVKMFLQADKQIMKIYSEIKNSALECHEQIIGSESKGQLENLIRILQNSSKLKLDPKQVKLAKSEQNNLEGQFKIWKSSKIEIEQFENMIKGYALKLVELVMQKNDTYSYEDDEQTKKENSKSYFMLRSKITQEISSKSIPEKPNLVESSLKINLPTVSMVRSVQNKTKRSKAETCQKSRGKQNKQDVLIQKILDLYRHN